MTDLSGFYITLANKVVTGPALVHDTCGQQVADDAEDMLSELNRYAKEHQCPLAHVEDTDSDPDYVKGEE